MIPPQEKLIDVARDAMRFLKACRYEFASDHGEAASLFLRLDEAVAACKALAAGGARAPQWQPEAEALFGTELVTQVFNAYTHQRPTELIFSKRRRVVIAMLRAMLAEESAIDAERAASGAGPSPT